MKDYRNLILIVIAVFLLIFLGSIYVYYPNNVLNNLMKNGGGTDSGVLIEAQEGGAWGGSKYIICRDGKFFIDKNLVAYLDESVINYLKSEFGNKSFNMFYSSDIRDAFDAYQTFELKYYANSPAIDLKGSVLFDNISCGVENASKSGDWEKTREYQNVFYEINRSLMRNIPKTEIQEIAPGYIIKASSWTQDNNLFLFNNDERYSMYDDKPLSGWPILNQQQLNFIDSIDYPIKTYKPKRDNYFVKDNELFNISINNLEGRVSFDYIPSSQNLLPAERIKEFDEELYDFFVEAIDHYQPDYFSLDLYEIRYRQLNPEEINKYAQFRSQEYFYINRGDDIYLLPIKFSKREQTPIYQYINMPWVVGWSIKSVIDAKEWTYDNNLFPFDLIYQIGEINYALDNDLTRNRQELNKDQLDFANELSEGLSYFVVDNKLFSFNKYMGDNSLIIKRYTIDHIYKLVQADILNVLGQNFKELYSRIKSGEKIEENVIANQNQINAYKYLPSDLAYYEKDGNQYKILIASTSIRKQFISPYKDLKEPSDFCEVEIDKKSTLNISKDDLELN